MSVAEKRAALLAQAQSLLDSPEFSKESKSKFDALVTMANEISPAGSEQRSVDVVDRQEKDEFRRRCLGEIRTQMDTTSAAPLIPQSYRNDLAIYSLAAGPFFADSPAVTAYQSVTGSVQRVPLTPDTEVGYVVDEDAQPLPNSFLASDFTSQQMKKFGSGRVVSSIELFRDVNKFFGGFDKLFLKAASNRLSRIQNAVNTAALRTAIAATTGAVVTAASPTAIAADDVFDTVYSISENYRNSPFAAFVMSSTVASAIARIQDTSGRKVFKFKRVPNADPTKPAATFLMGYPVYFVDGNDRSGSPVWASIAAGNDVLWFGDLSYVYVRSLTKGAELQTLTETYADKGQVGIILSQRAACDYAGAFAPQSPVVQLKMHA